MIARLLTAVAVGLVACSAPTALGSARMGGTSLELVDAAGNRLPTFQNAGRTYVLGAKGERYALHLRNTTASRVEFVASVDGRDVLDGQPSALWKRGYIVNPYSDVTIDGFRLSSESVAAFRFSSVRDSYAGRMGDARDVGVIGVGVFRELRHEIPSEVAHGDGYRRGLGNFEPAPPSTKGDVTDQEHSAEASASADAPPAPATAPADGVLSRSDDNGPTGAAEKSAGAESARAKKRPGLGTEFGEQRWSHVDEVAFERASAQPEFVLSVRYDDRQGLEAMGIDLHPGYSRRAEAELRETAVPFRRDPGYSNPPPGWTAY